MDSNIDNKWKRLKLYYGLLLIVLVVIGVSFAYFRLTKSQTNSNVIGTRTCLDTTLTEETSEITLAGSSGNGFHNHSTYLQENAGKNWWWTLSPDVFYAYSKGGGSASIFDVRSGDTGSLGANGVSNAIRPAISLVSDITISGGTGTSEDPYVVNW